MNETQLKQADQLFHVSGSGTETVVFAPALGATSLIWDPQISRFQDEYRVVTCETGAHDRVGIADVGTSLADRARVLKRIIDRTSDAAVHVVGLSMGGMLAQLLAIDSPDRVASLVLACTTSSYPPEAKAAFEERARTVESAGMEAVVDSILTRWFTSPFAQQRPDVIARIKAMLLAADPKEYASAARAVSEVNTTESLSRIAAPTLIISAERDQSIPAEAPELLTANIPNATSVQLSGVAHLCNMQDPESFNAEVSDFLLSLEGAT